MDLRGTCQEITRLWVQWWECEQLLALMKEEKRVAAEKARLVADDLMRAIGKEPAR